MRDLRRFSVVISQRVLETSVRACGLLPDPFIGIAVGSRPAPELHHPLAG